jgi:hypothetical protein
LLLAILAGVFLSEFMMAVSSLEAIWQTATATF